MKLGTKDLDFIIFLITFAKNMDVGEVNNHLRITMERKDGLVFNLDYLKDGKVISSQHTVEEYLIDKLFLKQIL